MGFLQVGNEYSTGHVERFLRVNMPLLDSLAVYFDGADTETIERLRLVATVVVGDEWSFFSDERSNKQRLLNAISRKGLSPDWLLRLDADEALYCDRSELEAVISEAEKARADAVDFAFINLWRDDTTVRLDSGFNDLRVPAAWRWQSISGFDARHGLHLGSEPDGLSVWHHCAIPIVHYGFASSDLVLRKVIRYEGLGQTGWSLNRLRDESNLVTMPLESCRAALGKRGDLALTDVGSQPEWQPWGPIEWEMHLSRKRKENIPSHPKVTIVCLIFASTEWLEFAYGEVLRLQAELGAEEVEILFVANDPNDDVRNFLKNNGIPHVVFSGRSDPGEWYINSVYRAYNAGVSKARGEYVLLVNSDMAYGEGFLAAMLRDRAPDLLLTASLVEPGVLKPALGVVRRNFGSNPRSFRRRAFHTFARKVRTDSQRPGCLFMPLLAPRELFLALGGFPEGNIVPESLDAYVDGQDPRIAAQGAVVVSGDAAFVARAERRGFRYRTTNGAWAYHFQEGELRSSRRGLQSETKSGILIVNDRLRGVNGEDVLWGRLVRDLHDEGIEVCGIQQEPQETLRAFWRRANSKSREYRVTFSNATFAWPLTQAARSCVLIQDTPASSQLLAQQRHVVRLADVAITNSEAVWNSYRRKSIYLTQVPLAPDWIRGFSSMQAASRSPRQMQRGLFIGSFTPTKGWPEVELCVERNPQIEWVAVSKYDAASDPSPLPKSNLLVKRQLTQSELRDLMQEADFLILGSPIETQCLVALEAISQDLPVVMKPTGLLAATGDLRESAGIFRDDLLEGIELLRARIEAGDPTLQPLDVFLQLRSDLTLDSTTEWVRILKHELRMSFVGPDVELRPRGMRESVRWARQVSLGIRDGFSWRVVQSKSALLNTPRAVARRILRRRS